MTLRDIKKSGLRCGHGKQGYRKYSATDPGKC
jgi:hypothetical protein